MKRIGIGAAVLVAVIAGIGLFAALWQQRATPPRQEFQNVVVQLKWQHQAQFAGIYAAKEKGMYRERGIEITAIHPGGPDSPPIPAVLSGEADFGVAGADDILVALAQEKPVRAIAVIYQESPVVYFSLKESGIEKPQDFIGKTVGLREGTGTYFTYVAMMKNLRIDRGQISEVPASDPGIDPLLDREVDVWPGFRTNEPKVAERLGYEVNLIKPEEYGVDMYADVLIATQEMIEENPDLVRAFVQATLDGWEWVVQQPEETVDMVMSYAKDTTREHQKDMLETSLPLIKPSQAIPVGQMNFSKWNRMYTVLRQQGIIPVDVDVNKAYTKEFVNL